MLPQRALKNREEKIRLAEGVALDLVEIPGGPFLIGEVGNQHRGNLATFWLGKYPVTNAQYNAYVVATGNKDHFVTPTISGDFMVADHPVVDVTWDDAVAFCNWLSKETGQHYGLPSETQWEYAARGGQDSEGFPYAGSRRLKEIAWYCKNSHNITKPVGLKFPNELGLYDMSGNVWEWCADYWQEKYQRMPIDGSAWLDGENEGLRVARGGCWDDNINKCRVSARLEWIKGALMGVVGFRLARYQPPEW